MKRVIADLQAQYPDAAISAQPIAIVSVIGSDISRPGLMPDAFQALAAAHVPIIAVQHQIRNVDVQFIVDIGHFDRAVHALHRALVEDATSTTEDRRAA